MCRALDSQARGSGAGFERAPGPSGEGAAGAGVAPPRALQSQGLGLGPRRTAGGAEAWPCAARGSSPCASLRGLGTAWPPPPPTSSRAGRTLGLQPSGPPATRREPLSRLRSWAGPESSDRAGPSRHEGSIIHGAPGRAPKTCSALSVSGEVGEKTGEKFPEQSWPHSSHFPKWPGLGAPMPDQGGQGVASQEHDWNVKAVVMKAWPHQCSCSLPEEQTGIRRAL